MIRFEPLPQIALTNLQPAFYDVESVTAIEMVSKFYSYLQNLVNDYNSFVTEVNTNIDDFESDITDKFECFRNCMIKTMNDYIESIDVKIALQDNRIAESIQDQNNTIADSIEDQNTAIDNAVNYMQTNIVSTTTNVVNTAIDNGDINISLTHDEPTEELSIIVTREGDNNGI